MLSESSQYLKKNTYFDGVLFFIKTLFANYFWMGQWIQNTNSSEPYCEGTQGVYNVKIEALKRGTTILLKKSHYIK